MGPLGPSKSAEHGDITNEFTVISEAEAEQIVARIRADAGDELYKVP